MKKYFTFDNENINGSTYWLRNILQAPLIYLFGLGILLQVITTYKRSRQFFDKGKAAAFTAFSYITSIFGTFLMIGARVDMDALGVAFIIGLACNVPHLYLMFANAKK